ncbi:hypothetical protein NL676_038284, partial [Syzygium grande]
PGRVAYHGKFNTGSTPPSSIKRDHFSVQDIPLLSQANKRREDIQAPTLRRTTPMKFLPASLLILALATATAFAYDPSPLQDFCVAINDPK